MANAIFWVPIPSQNSVSHRPCAFTSKCSGRKVPDASIFGNRSKNFIFLSSSSSSPGTSVTEDGRSPPAEDFAVKEDAVVEGYNEPANGGCRSCGRNELERGCNGEGRIQGGIAAVPGFGWWPIKAYRPCPGFLASGGRYRRQGQSMDEVAFGRGERGAASTGASTQIESSKSKPNARRFKS